MALVPLKAISTQMANGTSKLSQREFARAALTRVAAFSQCTEETLDRFATEGSIRTFNRGESISRRGDSIAALCVIISGSIEISITSPDGKRHVLFFAEGGQLFNVIGILDGGLGIHDAIAHEATVSLLIPRAIVLDAIDREPKLSSAFARLFCLRLRTLYEYIAENTLLPLRARCARMLLTFVESHGTTGPEGCVINLKFSQEDFADMLGCSRQSVNKELRSLEGEGLIKTSYSRFIIRDLRRLQAVAAHKG